MDWYAVFVESGKEEFVQKQLQIYFDDSVLRSIVPKRKLTERREGKIFHVIKKMFPGYLLIQTDMDIEKYYIIKNIPKLISILNTDTYYSKINEREIEIILKLMDFNDTVEYSSIYIENSTARVISGALQGLEGIIRKIDKRKKRAKIALSLMGEERIVDLGIEILNKIE
jgi:transcriptional antiterminator NusG